MATHRKFRCTSCGISQKDLSNSSCGKLKWKTKQGGRSNASGQMMVQSTQTQDSQSCVRSMGLRGTSQSRRHHSRMVW